MAAIQISIQNTKMINTFNIIGRSTSLSGTYNQYIDNSIRTMSTIGGPSISRVELGRAKLVDVRAELMGAYMLAKAVGSALLELNMRLIWKKWLKALWCRGSAYRIRRVCWNPVIWL